MNMRSLLGRGWRTSAALGVVALLFACAFAPSVALAPKGTPGTPAGLQIWQQRLTKRRQDAILRP